MNKTCPICKKVFKEIAPNHIYCSKSCKDKQYAVTHTKQIKIKQHNYYKKNKQKMINRAKKYYKTNSKKILSKHHKQYYKFYKITPMHLFHCVECGTTFLRKGWGAKYCSEECQKRYKKRPTKKNIHRKIQKALMRRMYCAIKQQHSKKYQDTKTLTGCSVEYLKQHLESQFTEGMSWDNYGKFHIDHILPCASFDLSKPSEQKKCFHYTNLQPLWAADNLSKGAKLCYEKK